jgi:intein/homing endonuclease
VLVAVTSAGPRERNAKQISEARATDVREREIPLHSLESRAADAATQLYNLDVDGDDTYVANGLVVHNKIF